MQAISEHEPRKGTETQAVIMLSPAFYANFRTRTPKGDGNVGLLYHLYVFGQIFRTRTPKGDGNF